MKFGINIETIFPLIALMLGTILPEEKRKKKEEEKEDRKKKANQLVEQASKGDKEGKEAFIELVIIFNKSIYEYCYKTLPDGKNRKKDAEDAAQTTFFNAYMKIVYKRKKPDNFEAYLYKIAHNNCLNVNKNKKIVEYGPSEFKEEEFISPYSIESLCLVINYYNLNVQFTAPDNSLERLNELLVLPNFFDIIPNKRKYFKKKVRKHYPLIKKIIELRKVTKKFRKKKFNELTSDEQLIIQKQNRLLLETLFPYQTPQHKRTKVIEETGIEILDKSDGQISQTSTYVINNPETLLIRKEIINDFNELDEIPIKHKSALILRYHEQFSLEETAQILNCRVSNVKTYCHRGIKKLRQFLTIK